MRYVGGTSVSINDYGVSEDQVNSLRWQRCDVFIDGKFRGVGMIFRWSENTYEIDWDNANVPRMYFGPEDVSNIQYIDHERYPILNLILSKEN